MTIDNRTTHLNLPLPHVDNQLNFDVDRLVSALTLLDAAVFARVTSADVNAAVAAAITALVGGAPTALDTLKELADAINDDANFAASVTTALAGKAALSHTHAQSDIIGLVSALSGKLGTAPASASNLGGIKVGSGLSVAGDGTLSVTNSVSKAGDTMTGAFNEAKGASVASASTVDLDNVAGNLVHVTGTTTINTITLAAGASRDIIFDGALTLTKSANLDLPSTGNITTTAGARASLRGDGSGKVIVMNYTPPTGNTSSVSVGSIISLNSLYGVYR